MLQADEIITLAAGQYLSAYSSFMKAYQAFDGA